MLASARLAPRRHEHLGPVEAGGQPLRQALVPASTPHSLKSWEVVFLFLGDLFSPHRHEGLKVVHVTRVLRAHIIEFLEELLFLKQLQQRSVGQVSLTRLVLSQGETLFNSQKPSCLSISRTSHLLANSHKAATLSAAGGTDEAAMVSAEECPGADWLQGSPTWTYQPLDDLTSHSHHLTWHSSTFPSHLTWDSTRHGFIAQGPGPVQLASSERVQLSSYAPAFDSKLLRCLL